ncbi:hypothetical protein B0H13DRAFT_1877190 [Mycena leptocephala]|nr:hypothetical protein B0H13DRAFT_1877190 [Mycena leptocephala]
MTSNSQFTGLTPKQVEFCDQFPDGRLCRFINRRSGTLLDVRPSLTLVDDEVPQVVGKLIPLLFSALSHQDLRLTRECGNLRCSICKTFRWIIKPHGNGQAIIPVPKDGSNTVMYLTASGLLITVAVTVSPFPSPGSLFRRPTPLPALLSRGPLFRLDLPRNGLRRSAGRTQQRCPEVVGPVVIYPYGATQQQFWRIQFLQYQSTAHW